MLTIKVGPKTNDVAVMLDGANIAPQLRIARIEFDPMEPGEITRARLVVYADAEVELLPQGINVLVVDPASPAYDGTAIDNARAELTLAYALLGMGTERERTNARHRVQHALDELGGPITNTDEPKPYTGPVRKP
jgi:hypothetical protein